MNDLTESPEFKAFYEGLVERITGYFKKEYPTLAPPKYSFKKGKKFVKIIRDTSVYAFIQIDNGDVLRPASWNAPAKHARGNIYADDHGLGCCGPYGVAYLR